MLTFRSWLIQEANWVLGRGATWGLALPAKTKEGFKVISGNEHPTATHHDALAKAHFGVDSKTLMQTHGAIRYSYQHPDHELKMDLTTDPKATRTAHHFVQSASKAPKHLHGALPQKYVVDFHDKPSKGFDTEWADDPAKDAQEKLRRASLVH
jgi:hypothetical protein